ncbi:PAS domain-containing sensor histidine kinase [Paraburkholderia sp.]|uniref:PAS domain-containing sensor histidine kinase n=1 Tax=Paraburkholderia sp. TaxID=1926495 RepID=UPI0023A03F3A|nr:PAS domain-containing sensor histidine kinase [Paraburkholderia sp.]MDE1179764.1 PAS domain-containing sensor histidine kinase [Paraburkholderia sp.]
MDSRQYDPSEAPTLDAAAAFECLPDAYLILNRRHEVVLANARYLDLVGQSMSDIRGRPVHDINQFGSATQREARRSLLETALRQVTNGESDWSPLLRYEMPGRRESDGGKTITRYWKIKASLLPARGGPAGHGGYIAVRVSEETDRVEELEREQRERAKLRSQAQLRQVLADEARAQLREHQERFQIAMTFSQLGAWELDPATGMIECTDQCKRNLGLSTSDVLTEGRLFDEIVHPDDRPRLRAAMGAALDRREHFEVDYRTGWTDGPARWILVRGVGRYREDGSLAMILGFTLDITVRKEAELEQQAIAENEKRAREHSEHLATAMDHFVTTVSHELRSPLNAILLWTDLLQRAGDPQHLARATGVIQRNARQLSHMVDDLLDSGAIVTGKLSVHLQPVDIGALAGHVAEDIRMNAEAKGLKLIADDLASSIVMADENRMKQIVWNLLSNAVKFSPEGTVELSVRERDGMVELAVRDTGRGIDAESLGRIFERFEQVNEDGSGRVAGLGLGLWLVKNLVDLHRGQISARSDGPGQGATFVVRVPVYR